ncbi:ABC transporter ATP-binding protein [Marinomonas agarivorans]|nr:ABC transporter ATP-binding protein [Marinomonas agarivorans]
MKEEVYRLVVNDNKLIVALYVLTFIALYGFGIYTFPTLIYILKEYSISFYLVFIFSVMYSIVLISLSTHVESFLRLKVFKKSLKALRKKKSLGDESVHYNIALEKLVWSATDAFKSAIVLLIPMITIAFSVFYGILISITFIILLLTSIIKINKKIESIRKLISDSSLNMLKSLDKNNKDEYEKSLHTYIDSREKIIYFRAIVTSISLAFSGMLVLLGTYLIIKGEDIGHVIIFCGMMVRKEVATFVDSYMVFNSESIHLKFLMTK